LPWISKKINQHAISHYLTFMVTPAPLTLYESIYKLPAGFYAKIDASKMVTFHEWYNLLMPSTVYSKRELNDEQFCVGQIRSLLRQSVKQQMIADVPFGVFLSGGIDSSLNVALMSEFTDQVKTFNVSFSDGPEIVSVFLCIMYLSY
jgi:asparagine synthase (glutamine-hydrolysing)